MRLWGFVSQSMGYRYVPIYKEDQKLQERDKRGQE